MKKFKQDGYNMTIICMIITVALVPTRNKTSNCHMICFIIVPIITLKIINNIYYY